MFSKKLLKTNNLLAINTKLNKFYESSILGVNNQIQHEKLSTSPVTLQTSPEKISRENLLFPENKSNKNDRADKISKAMVYYLEKLNEREELMKEKTEEFEIGKRHLAKMMGENPETFSQDKIDEAVRYLLPSGLFEPKARPFLKHPKEYYPKSRVSMFNENGRPISHLFYTGQSELFQLTYDVTQKLINLKKLEDALGLLTDKVRGHNMQGENKIDLSGLVWMDNAALSKKLSKNIDEVDYNKFMNLLKKLAEHSFSIKEAPFIKEFLLPFVPPIKMSDIEEPEIDDEGRRYRAVATRLRTARCSLKLIEGTGKVSITSDEGIFDISYFETLTHRQQILFPFKVVDRMNKFDLSIRLNQGGMSCLAKCIRYATSKALCSFVSAENIEKLRLAGLLTLDIRNKERKKYGKEGARRAYTWKKR